MLLRKLKTYQQGGYTQTNPQQMMQQVAQMLQQGEDPKVCYQNLVQSGVDPQQAQQMIQSIMQQLQGAGEEQQPEMQKGGLTDAEARILYKNPRYVQSAVNAEKRPFIGPPEYVASQAAQVPLATQYIPDPRSVGANQPQIIPVPVFVPASKKKLAQVKKAQRTQPASQSSQSLSSSRPSGTGTVADWFEGNEKDASFRGIPESSAKGRMSGSLNQSFITPGNRNMSQYLKSQTPDYSNLNDFQKIENSYNSGKTFLDLQGKEKQFTPLAALDKGLTVMARDFGLPVAKTLSGVGNTLDKVQTALSVVPFALAAKQAIAPTATKYATKYATTLMKTLINQSAKQLPKLASKRGLPQAIDAYARRMYGIENAQVQNLMNAAYGAAKNPTQYKKLMKMIKQTSGMMFE